MNSDKSLYRIKNSDTQLGGVALGLAEYFAVDVTVVRFLLVILFFTPIPVFTAYVILWLFLPVKDAANYQPATTNTVYRPFSQSLTYYPMNGTNNQGGLIAGAILIILGIFAAFRIYFNINLFHIVGNMWPLALIALGAWLIVRDRPNKKLPPNDSIGGSTNDFNSYE